MAKSLDDRITAAMGNGARTATVQQLIDELASVITDAETRRDEQRAISISPTVSEADAEAAADEAARLDRRIVRMTGKREALTERLEELLTSERRRALEADYQAAKEERDLLVAELTEWWPQLQNAMIELLGRMKASDERCKQINQRRGFGLPELVSAEVEARGCTGLYKHPTLLGLPMPSLLDLRLHHFHARDFSADGALAWPPKDGTADAVTSLGNAFSEMERAYERRREWMFPGTTKAAVA
ncbi:MAG: hypothetical protein JNN10_16195 [Sphingopyxis sp.]|uniref:hypothetical protein n=1 Tax=Sphingopyxis sp. TaxID=1908224 RepID=UPI001A3E8F91|nr:hypothetical protein [Sphingopyxis sp.]MBL9067823.1 hypothetical protein [Sphingopyxis sp.]